MSHFTRVKTVIRDQAALCEALRDLHCRYEQGERVLIRGFAGNTEYGQVVVNTGSPYDIGFQRQADGAFNVCADWWGVQGNTALREESFLQQVNQTYARRAVLAQVREQGLIVEEEIVLPGGEIEFVLAQAL